MAVSLGFHIVFAALGIGLPLLLVFTEFLAIRRHDDVWMALTRRWSKALGILVAVGAVSGTVLSFALGLFWPGLMGRWGSVIGLPFALEAFAFFIEAIFIGIYLYGWDRLTPWAHWFSGWPVVLGWSGERVVRRHRERVDAVARRVRALGERQGRRRAADPGDAEPVDAGDDDAHDPGRLHGDGAHGRVDLRRRHVEGQARPLPPAGARRRAHVRAGARARAGVRGRSGREARGRASADEARGAGRAVGHHSRTLRSRSVGSRCPDARRRSWASGSRARCRGSRSATRTRSSRA